MPIVCPHCATSYNVDSAQLGTGRTVRCARCKQVWTAMPEPALAMAGDLGWADDAPVENRALPIPADPPVIESPSIAADYPGESGTGLVPLPAMVIDAVPVPAPVNRRTGGRRAVKQRRKTNAASLRLPTSIAAMGALIASLLIWRGDVVRLMPQTAMVYKTIGLDVNLRGLSFRDVKLGSETVEGKPVLVIEGAIVDILKKPLEIPRLRFVVRDAHGAAIYAWNANAEEVVIQPGERIAFRSRLAQPPQEARSIDVRFFHKRDLAAGAA